MSHPVGSHSDGAFITTGVEDCIGSMREFVIAIAEAVTIVGCGFLEGFNENPNMPCTLRWLLQIAVNQQSPDLGVRCICDGF
jgi:hypothetical protein